MNDKKPQGFFIYADRFSAISSMLSMADLGRLVAALCVYFDTGEPPRPRSRAFDACFEMLRADVDRDIARYREICERNRERVNRRWHPEPPDTAAYAGIPPDTNTTHPSAAHPSVNQPNANQPNAAQARTALKESAASPSPCAARPSAVPAQNTGNAFPMTNKGGMIHERTERKDPRFARCTAI